jgi:hypothetical protein
MDKEKLIKYAGYAGLGLISGYISVIVYFGWSSGQWDPLAPVGFYSSLTFILLLQFLFNQFIGGLLGYAIIKKWWGALIGGFVLTWVALYAALSLSS